MMDDNDRPEATAGRLQLREVIDSDLDIFFEYQQDPAAIHMAAFTAENPADRAAFDAHWARIRANEANINRTIVWNGRVAGNLGHFVMFGRPQVSYWLGREFWGRGLATRALTAFLEELPVRPLYAQAAADNAASIRVLQKCGFKIIGRERGYANARGQEIEEVILMLTDRPAQAETLQPGVQPVTAADFPRLVDVWEAAVRATHHFIAEEDIEFFRPRVRSGLARWLEQGHLACVRDPAGVAAGFVGIRGENVDMLFIHPDWRGQGIGRRLLRYAVEERGAVTLDVNEQNDQAVGFYRRMGFEVNGRSDRDSTGKPYPILHMRLKDRDKIAGPGSQP